MLESPFNTVAGLQACNCIKKRVNIAKVLGTPILKSANGCFLWFESVVIKYANNIIKEKNKNIYK